MNLKSKVLHELKTDPEVFAAVARGVKTHEIRLNDRGFAVGDTLLLRETESTGSAMRAAPKLYPLVYTGRTEERTVSHIQTGYGLADGWCILSFAAPAAKKEDELSVCAADRDGECRNAKCPQLRDNEPAKTGRHCPIDTFSEED